jgi:hypothetical protein
VDSFADFRALDLHDSTLIGIQYRPARQELLMEVDVCNWRQEGYLEGDPEVLPYRILFRGVKSLSFAPDDDSLLHHDEILSCEISEVDSSSRCVVSLLLAASPPHSGTASLVIEVVAGISVNRLRRATV